MSAAGSRSDRYDYVIVGAGSAGCVMANRLSADPACRVLLLEAGGSDRHPYISIPIGIGALWRTRMFDWGYFSEPQDGLAGKRVPHARGKVLGGSSSINALAFTRGHPGDYDRWAREGATGWSYGEVLPYFKRLETWEGGEGALRGGSGPIQVQYGRIEDDLFDAFLASGKAAGYPFNADLNGTTNEGFALSQSSIGHGRRSSASRAYLRPALRRRNLTVKTGALAHRVILDGTRAAGIAYAERGRPEQAIAESEVILCGGTFNTPQLLMLSGIGPADHLRELGIAPIVNLPVGNNFQDHLYAPMLWERRAPGPFHAQLRYDRLSFSLLQAYVLRNGPATAPPGAFAFIKTRPELEVPDLEFLFRAAPPSAQPWFPLLAPPYADGYMISPAILHPRSRGEVRLRSRNPSDLVRIDGRFLSVSADLRQLRDGIRLVRELFGAGPLEAFYRAELAPGPAVQSDDDLDAYIRAAVVTVSHPAGTCRMGSDELSVLGPDLRVRGIEALRVVDASAMPDLPSGHINAAVLMMAEKASDLITRAGAKEVAHPGDHGPGIRRR